MPMLDDKVMYWNTIRPIDRKFSIKLLVLLSSLSTKISKPFRVKYLQMRNNLPVTGLVLLGWFLSPEVTTAINLWLGKDKMLFFHQSVMLSNYWNYYLPQLGKFGVLARLMVWWPHWGTLENIAWRPELAAKLYVKVCLGIGSKLFFYIVT